MSIFHYFYSLTKKILNSNSNKTNSKFRKIEIKAVRFLRGSRQPTDGAEAISLAQRPVLQILMDINSATS